MKKFLILAALIPLTACVEEGPPNYNERDRRAYNSLQDVNHRDDCVNDPHCRGVDYRDPNYNHGYDHHYDEDGYYDSNHVWHYTNDAHDTDEPDYNPHDGHDHWARQSN